MPTHSPHLPPSLSVSLLSLCLPFFLFLSPTASHSPLLLSLFSLARSSLSPTQLYSTGIEMGLSLPGARRHEERQSYTAAYAHTHVRTYAKTHKHRSKSSQTSQTASGDPADVTFFVSPQSQRRDLRRG